MSGQERQNQRAQRLQRQVEAGEAVVANQRTDGELIEWAKGKGLLVRVDRTTRWGNPFRLANQGDSKAREDVCQRYREEHLPARPDLLEMVPDLRGKVLACWCSPKQCHADTLAEMANGGRQ